MLNWIEYQGCRQAAKPTEYLLGYVILGSDASPQDPPCMTIKCVGKVWLTCSRKRFIMVVEVSGKISETIWRACWSHSGIGIHIFSHELSWDMRADAGGARASVLPD